MCRLPVGSNLVRKYQDGAGKMRYSGTKSLKQSQSYPPGFCKGVWQLSKEIQAYAVKCSKAPQPNQEVLDKLMMKPVLNSDGARDAELN